jgi:hypothetical protein
VRFRWASRNEVHTVTFGPAAYVVALEKGFESGGPTFPAEAVYPSDPPGAGPTSHGNGLSTAA